jgi:hypothetical protein
LNLRTASGAEGQREGEEVILIAKEYEVVSMS